MNRTLNCLVVALSFAGIAAPAMAQPTVRPIGVGSHTYDNPGLAKYRLMSPNGATHLGGVMRWYYNDSNRPASIGKADTISRIQTAMSRWSAVCNITFQYQGETAAGFSLQQNPMVFDGVNVLGWDATTLSAPTTAMTTIAWDGDNNIIDAEARFNAAFDDTVIEFDATATHEVGHMIGIDHSEYSNQVMSGPPMSNYDGMYALAADDIAGCVELYGSPTQGSAGATSPGSDTQAPAEPNITATAVSDTQIQLTWNVPTDNVAVTSYNLYNGNAPLGVVSGTSAMAESLSPSTTYWFSVSACDAAGNCSTHSLTASATTLPAAPSQTTSRTPATNYQDMWWGGASENGWGVTVTQHSDALFLSWYLYDGNGNPSWIVMPSGTWNAAHTTYSGALYIPSGSWFGNYDPSRFAVNSSVGSASVTFTSDSSATLVFTVGGVTTIKSISRLAFGPVDPAPITDYTDMWWGGASENGWGVALTQQYHSIFAAWYTYDTNGQTMWYVMPNGTWAGNTYSGALYSTKSKPVIGTAYDPSALAVTQVGTLTLTFNDASNATMTYTVNGVTQSKPIARMLF